MTPIEFIKEDSLNFTIETKWVKLAIVDLYEDYANIKGNNWEFVTDPGKYNYKKTMSILNDELVYEISFKPKKSGLFQGNILVSTSTYAVVQLDIEYAEGKETEKIQMFGFGHLMKFRKAYVIYEKGES